MIPQGKRDLGASGIQAPAMPFKADQDRRHRIPKQSGTRSRTGPPTTPPFAGVSPG
jgi:hypothetical protein